MTKNEKTYPPYLAAVDRRRSRMFILAPPHLCAIKIDGAWQVSEPLPDEEIPYYELVTDLAQAMKIIQQARQALEKKEVN